MFRKLILVALSSGLMTSCATTQYPLPKELVAGGIPRFDGHISPITIPIRPRYKPVESNIKVMLAVQDTETSTGGNNTYAEITGIQKVEKSGEMLIWETLLDKMFVNGKAVPDQLGARMLTDSLGNVHEVETIGNFGLDSSADFHTLATRFGRVLSEREIRTGDPLFKSAFNLSANLSAFLDIISEAIPDGFSIKHSSDVFNDNEIEYITNGWAFWAGRKVVVASHNENENADIIVTASEGDVSVTIKLNARMKIDGYEVFDADTFQMVKSHSVISLQMTSPSLELDFGIKVFGLMEVF